MAASKDTSYAIGESDNFLNELDVNEGIFQMPFEMMKDAAYSALEMSVERLVFMSSNSEKIPEHIVGEMDRLKLENGFLILTKKRKAKKLSKQKRCSVM